MIGEIISGILNPFVQGFTNMTQTLESKREFDANNERLENEFAETQERLKNEFSQNLQYQNDALQMQKDIAQNNLAMQQSQFDYQKQLNETQMEREDSALQRQMADAQKAGLSPLSVVGGNGASSSPLSSANAPQLDASGISAMQSQYLDLARTYSSLYMNAYSNYQNNRSNAFNQRQAIKQQEKASRRGARVALAQMVTDASLKGLQLDQGYQNLKMQKALNDSQLGLNAKQMENIESEIQNRNSEREYRDAELEWNRKNGFRSQNLEALTIALANRVLSKPEAEKAIQSAWNDVKDTLDFRSDANVPVESLPNDSFNSTKSSVIFYKNAFQALLNVKFGKDYKIQFERMYNHSPNIRRQYKSSDDFYNSNKNKSLKELKDLFINGKVFK